MRGRSEGLTARKKSDGGAEKLSQYLRLDAVLVDLVVDSKEDLYAALAEVAVENADEETVEAIREGIVEREASVTTYVGDGVAIPVARVEGVERVALALATNSEGFPFGLETDQPVCIAVLVVGNDDPQSDLVQILSSVAAALKDANVRARILSSADAAAMRRCLDAAPRRARRKKTHRLTQLLLSHSRKIALEMGATAVVIAVESLDELKVIRRLPRRDKFIVATSSREIAASAEDVVKRVLLLPKVSLRRDARVRLTALMAIAHGLIARGDVVAFLSGREGGSLDSMTIMEISREFGRFAAASGALSTGMRPEIFERVITLATDIAREGREGQRLGATFIIGDPEELDEWCQQMVMNPFRGYPEEERNILDPTLEETIKEFATIDGAFVISTAGVLSSAGTYLKAPKDVDLPGGYGSRHRSACGLTGVAPCIAVTVSQSTGEVNVYHRGETVLQLAEHVPR